MRFLFISVCACESCKSFAHIDLHEQSAYADSWSWGTYASSKKPELDDSRYVGYFALS